jgi:hypothetical protein
MKFNRFSARRLARIAILFALPLAITASRADNFTTALSERDAVMEVDASIIATSSWDTVVWQPGSVSPTPGNTYEILNGGFIWNPTTGGVQAFPGDSVTLDHAGALGVTGPADTTLNFPGVAGQPGLILNGGRLRAAQWPVGQSLTIAGQIYVAARSVIDYLWAPSGFIITAQITGNGNLTVITGGLSSPLDIQSKNNPYTGNWGVARGFLRGSGDGSLGSGNIIIGAGAMFELSYDIQSPGTLALLESNSVMVLHQNCQFSAVSINGVTLAPGAYTFNNLLAQFPGNFAPGGSGGITVPAVQSTFVPPPVTAPGYYVDYAGGSDANPGTDPATAWQHCPGDPAATGVAGSTPLNPGDTVFFKGGVQYVLTGDGNSDYQTGIGLNWSGTSGQPITYDGNSAGTWGVGNAILLGSDTNFVLGFDPVNGASNIAFTHSIFVGPVGEADANGNNYVCQFGPSVSNGPAATDTYIEQTDTNGSAIMYNGNPWFKGASNGFSLAYEMVANSLGTNMYVIEAGSPPSPTNTVLFYTQSD